MSRGVGEGEHERRGRALPGLGFELDCPFVFLGGAMYDGQTKAFGLPVAFRREEGIKDAVHLLFLYSFAIIFHFDRDELLACCGEFETDQP